MWIHHLLMEIGPMHYTLEEVRCDNQDALYIASYPAHHERTKHIEVNNHFIYERFQENFDFRLLC